VVNRKAIVALTIAGSDNSGGAGIQADLKTFTRLGVYGTSALTCVVAEHPGRVSSIAAIDPELVAEQIKLVFEAFPVGAVKTGMLFSSGIIRQVAKQLGKRRGLKLVVDPVMVATSGAALLKPEAERAMAKLLFPQAALVTPNLDEAARLVGKKLKNPEQAKEAALELAKKWKVPFLVKGGHLMLAKAEDYLAWPNGKLKTFTAIRCKGVQTHGTGCTYSAAICAGLAKGLSLESSVGAGKRFITRAIQRHLRIGRYTPLNHLSA
jgi:hydroxymethylpyrimidine/phosphomethylpyrimidine kinase